MKCKFPSCNHEARIKGYCISCYQYFILHNKKLYKIPPKQTVSYNSEGELICHICGKAFKKLGQHICQAHDMSIKEYKERFELNHNTKLTAKTYQDKMRGYTKEYYDLVITKNLINNGKDTRIKKNDQLRKNKTHHKVNYILTEN